MKATVTYAELLAHLGQHSTVARPEVIAIGGFGGSGKSTLASKLKADLQGQVEIVSGDDFSITQQSVRCDDWRSIDRQRILDQLLNPLRSGDTICYQVYDWSTDSLGAWRTIKGVSHIVLEGVGIIHPDLLRWFDVSVWLDCPLETATERGRVRDRDEYGVDHDLQWSQLWAPNDLDYFERFRPDQLSDLVLTSGL